MTDPATDPVLSTNALVWPMLQAMKSLGHPAHISEIDAAVVEREHVSPEVKKSRTAAGRPRGLTIVCDGRAQSCGRWAQSTKHPIPMTVSGG